MAYTSGGQSDRGDRSDRGERGGPGNKRRGKRRPKVCFYCVDKIKAVDYKDVDRLRKYVSERGKIVPRRVTGNCANHQRQLTVALKRARYMALLPYSAE